MIKTFLELIIAASFIILSPLIANARSGGCGGQTYWSFEDDTLTISGTGETSNFAGYSNYGVSYPGWDDLKNEIKHVVIEPGITYIGNNAFYQYTNLETVTLPEGLIKIGNYTFYGCNKLTSITFPESLKIIGNTDDRNNHKGFTFANCNELTEITIPENLQFLGRRSFYSCNKLKKVNWNAINCDTDPSNGYNDNYRTAMFAESPVETVNFGPKVISVARDLFYDMPSVMQVNTHGTINYIGAYAFYNTKWLRELQFDSERVIYIDNVAYSFNTDVNRHDGLDVTIRPGTQCLTDYIFLNLTRLEKISIPESVTRIGNNAFKGCSSLMEVQWSPIELEDYPEYNGEKIFFGTALNKIKFGDNVHSLPSYFLWHCEGLTNIELPESLQIIKKHALEYCNGLTSLTIPDNVEIIEEYGISDCSHLEKLTIGENVKTIIGANSLFPICPLSTLEWNAINADNLSFNPNYGVNVTNFIVGDKVEYIPNNLLSGATSLNNVELGKSVLEIGKKSFYGCKNLKSVNFPQSLQKIGEQAFEKTSLSEIIIPENIRSIASNCFQYAPLEHIFFLPIEIPKNCFNTTSFPKVTMYVPDCEQYINAIWGIDTELVKPYAIFDKDLFTSENIDQTVNFTSNVPGYAMEILHKPEINFESGQYTSLVEARFSDTRRISGNSEFIVRFVYNYEVELDSTITLINDLADKSYVVKRYNLAGIPVDESYKGITIIIYSNGSKRVGINN